MFILLAVIIVIALVIIVAAAVGNKKNSANPATNQNPASETNSSTTGAPAGNNATNTPATAGAGVVNPLLKDAVVVVPGTNPVKDNKVLTQTGETTVNNVTPMAPNAPQQTSPLAPGEKLAPSVIKVSATVSGFSPAQFSTKAGAPTTIALTSGDKSTHILMFDDSSLSAVALGAGPGETRAITFNAPTKAGEYTFRCDIPGHAGRGEVGKMIVQ